MKYPAWRTVDPRESEHRRTAVDVRAPTPRGYETVLVQRILCLVIAAGRTVTAIDAFLKADAGRVLAWVGGNGQRGRIKFLGFQLFQCLELQRFETTG